MTHLVDAVSAEVLAFLAAAPRSLQEIRGLVATYVGEPDVSEDEVEQGLLQPMALAGLLESTSS